MSRRDPSTRQEYQDPNYLHDDPAPKKPFVMPVDEAPEEQVGCGGCRTKPPFSLEALVYLLMEHAELGEVQVPMNVALDLEDRNVRVEALVDEESMIYRVSAAID